MEDIINVLGEEEFNEALDTDKPVLVDFWATWCYPCKMQAPILHELNEEVGDKVRIVKVDVDQNESLCYKYNIQSIPALMVFKGGEVVDKTVGVTELKSLTDMVLKHA